MNENIKKLHDLLSGRSFIGSSWELARAAGMSWRALWNALRVVRTPEWIDEHGWTVPYVRSGAQANTWWLSDALEHVDNQRMRTSQRGRAEDMLSRTRRNIAQAELALSAVSDGRSTAAKHWNRVLVMLRATEVQLETALEDEGW